MHSTRKHALPMFSRSTEFEIFIIGLDQVLVMTLPFLPIGILAIESERWWDDA